ncbi:MAG TPA: hypothetical protein VM140_05435, partial [Burkholderiales bacterium]|nr:hypothetical protein [Burkholderiales bacterium]
TVVSHHKKMDGHKPGEDDGGHHAGPVPRDPDLPDVSGTTLAFFAGGSLVVFFVSLVAFFG